MQSSNTKSQASLSVPGITPEGPRILVSRTTWTLILFWIILGLLWLIPGPLRDTLLRARQGEQAPAPAPPGSVVTARQPGPVAPPVAPPAAPQAPTSNSAGGPTQAEVTPKPVAAKDIEQIQDPHGSLKHFYAAWTLTARKKAGAITRVLHYGDSLIDLDRITGPLRRRLQARYGNAGRGFVLAGKPWRWYAQKGVTVSEPSDAWFKLRLLRKRYDGRLGLGLTAFEPKKTFTWVRINLAPQASGTSLEVLYDRRPRGGSFQLFTDKQAGQWIKTAAEHKALGSHRVTVTTPPGKVLIKVRGKARLFGVIMERRGPGITWENLPLVGTRFHHLVGLDEAHWAEQLQHRQPDLVVFQFGANDTISFGKSILTYGEKVLRVLKRVRKALPKKSCMVIGPLDRAQRDSRGRLVSPKNVKLVKDTQRGAAHAAGCAFWDGQQAMGGPGAMALWARKGWAVKDYIHVTRSGSEVFAGLLDRALEYGFAQSRKKSASRQ